MIFRLLLFCSLLPCLHLSAQEETTGEPTNSKSFFASYGFGLVNSSLEVAAGGPRAEIVNLFDLGYEIRPSFRFSWLLGIAYVHQTSGRSNVLPANVPPAPFDQIHPYSSRYRVTYLNLGGQYNIQRWGGEFSFAAGLGPGLSTYIRTFDQLRTSIRTVGPGDDLFLRTAANTHEVTWRLRGWARISYNYWFSTRLGFSLGLGYGHSIYLGGGVETERGTRYVIDDQQFAPQERDLLYNINYDRTTLTADPSRAIRHLFLQISLASRI